jgi:hypothetical protein
MSASLRILYVRKLTHGLYFVTLYSGVNHPLRVGFPEGPFSIRWPGQQAGLIRYVRGHITILDRQGLEAASCECYQVVKTEFDRLLG